MTHAGMIRDANKKTVTLAMIPVLIKKINATNPRLRYYHAREQQIRQEQRYKGGGE